MREAQVYVECKHERIDAEFVEITNCEEGWNGADEVEVIGKL